MNGDERERYLKETRERVEQFTKLHEGGHRFGRAYVHTLLDIVKTLLSLLDRAIAIIQEQGEDAYKQFRENGCLRFEAVELQKDAESAATSMRDKCVEKVKELGAGWKSVGDRSCGSDEIHFYGKADAADDIAVELQSLTLDQQEKQKS